MYVPINLYMLKMYVHIAMPRPGSMTFTVSAEKHAEAKEIAKKLNLTLKEYIEKLIGIIPETNYPELILEVPQIERN